MRRMMLAAFLATLGGQAAAQTMPGPHNGVIKPDSNVDPGMKVVSPRTHARMPVVHPPSNRRAGHHKHVTVVPK